MGSSAFYAMPEDEDLYMDYYDVKAGRWPENDRECVLVVSENGAVSDFILYMTGLEDPDRLDAIMKNIYKSCVEAAEEAGKPGNLAVGANVAGFLKVAEAMKAQGVV